MKIKNDEGVEIEVFTADDVKARETAAVSAATAEFGKTKAQIESERDEAKKALADRTGEFARFRKLSDDQVKQLTEKDRIIYENGLALAKANDDRIASEKKVLDGAIDTAIKSKAGSDEKLITKMKEMWGIIGVEATTPEQIENKTKMILGAIATTQPDLVASVAGFTGGSFQPPVARKDDKSFADTDAGKKAASDLGLILETPKAK